MINVSLQKGITLIESLVALLVVTIGISAIINLQFRSVGYSFDSYQQGIAIIQANDLVERTWAGACYLDDEDVQDQIIFDWCTAHSIKSSTCSQTSISFAGSEVDISITYEFDDKVIASSGSPQSFIYSAKVPKLNCE